MVRLTRLLLSDQSGDHSRDQSREELLLLLLPRLFNRIPDLFDSVPDLFSRSLDLFNRSADPLESLSLDDRLNLLCFICFPSLLIFCAVSRFQELITRTKKP